MTPTKTSVLWALVAGALLGVILARALPGPRLLSPEKRHHRMTEKLSRKLGLSAEQKERLKAVLEAKRVKMRALRDEFEPKFEDLRESTRLEIRGLLDAEQQAKFDRIEANWRKRDERRRGRRHRGP